MNRAAAALIVAASVLVVAWLAGSPHAWDTERPASCMPDHCFCEAVRAGRVRQPANTWSSLAFVAAGLWLLGTSRGARRDGSAAWPPVPDAAFALALAGVGLGSAYLHAALTFAGQFCDVLGMYLAATLLALVNLVRLGWLPPSRLWAVFVAANLPLAAALFYLPGARRYLFAAIVLVTLAAERQRRAPRLWLRAAVALFLAAFVAWSLDITHTLCAPTSWLQGHALWHLLAAASAGCYWRHLAGARPA